LSGAVNHNGLPLVRLGELLNYPTGDYGRVERFTAKRRGLALRFCPGRGPLTSRVEARLATPPLPRRL